MVSASMDDKRSMVLEYKPDLSLEDALTLARTHYNLQATGKPLPSERDQNFLLEAQNGEKYVLKIANATDERALLEAQNQVMAHLRDHGVTSPQVYPGITGDLIQGIQTPKDFNHWVRLVSYISGTPLARVKRHSTALLNDIGRQVGLLSNVLAEFDHPALHYDSIWGIANSVRIVEDYKSLIGDREFLKLIEDILEDFNHRSAQQLSSLRRSVLHNDINDYNLLVGNGDGLSKRNQRVIGVIDFGDMVYSYTIAELAITLAYVVLNKTDPLEAAMHVVDGYHQVYPLTEAEISVLFSLVRMRLCASVCMAAYRGQVQRDKEYLTISQGPIRKTLPLLAQIHPRFAEAAFRQACGLEPRQASQVMRDWLGNKDTSFAPVLGAELNQTTCKVFDLSVGSPLIAGGDPEIDGIALINEMPELLEAAGVQIGIGQYSEARLREASPGLDSANERPAVHLGIDIYARAGAPIFAPLSGTVQALCETSAAHDGSPIVILKHQATENQEFYTLYSHIDIKSLDALSVGQVIEKGEAFAALAAPLVGAGSTSFLHFQVITDLLDLDCGFPGYCRFEQKDIWMDFSLDPNLILRIPEACFPKPTPSKAETLAARRKSIGPNLSIGYKDPVKVVRGWMQYLYDETGRKYLDAYNNVPHVGHCHPGVVQAGREQMGVLNANTRYLHDNLVRYAERITSTLPDPLRICYFVNSGSEANELALRLARAYTGQRDTIVLEAAYHGHTTSLIDISPYKHDGPGGEGPPPRVHSAPIPDVFRGPFKSDDPQAGEKYAHYVLDIIRRLREKDVGLAGFIAETCPSVGGQIIPPVGYFAALYQHVREAGGVNIADEVQTGYGRTGTHFYAFEAQGVVPDILVLGKPIGNGHPLGAVITTPEIAASFDTGMEFFSTFGGNTVSCAIGLAVLEIVLGENLQDHALDVGNYLLEKLRPFEERYPIVGDVRGSGLFLGIELVRDRESLEPAAEEASFICNRMREHGILLGTDGPYHNVIKIRPPMPFDKQNADTLVSALEKILEEDFDPSEVI